jgi:putative molybdopterin biosynthesis protein
MSDRIGNTPVRSEELLAAIRAAARQEQFLEVVSPEEASQRFERSINLKPLGVEAVTLADSLGRVLADNVAAPVDAPPFDRSNVDGFALKSIDTVGASDANPRILLLNGEVLACGTPPTLTVAPGTATAIATGGMIPRGADAVAMIESTDFLETEKGPAIEIRRALMPGQFVSFAGSDIARGETLLRRGVQISSREIGILAACGIAEIEVVRKPKVAVLSTGDELVEPGKPLPTGAVYDSNGAIIAASIAEAGGVAVPMGAFPDDENVLRKVLREAIGQCDLVVLSGGTSKGAGDFSHRIVSELGSVLVHGVALKPGKPLCLAVVEGKPVVVLPGFPTSAIFTFHAFVAPVIRAWAGLPKESTQVVEAQIPVRVPSEIGRKEFMLVSLIDAGEGAVALPSSKGSGAVTSFSLADGFIEVDALAASVEAGSQQRVTLIGKAVRPPDLVITGSHDLALDIVISAVASLGYSVRTITVGSQGGAAAAARGECDIAPVHLIDTSEGPTKGQYNVHLKKQGLLLVRGWRRMQGIVYRKDDARFAGKTPAEAVQSAASDVLSVMVNRNAGSGTRILIDKLLSESGVVRPAGYANQPKSHNAVAAAVVQGRADWGVAIEPAARLYGLGFLPIAPEQYDFLIVESRGSRPAVQVFLTALQDEEVLDRIHKIGMDPSGAGKQQ